MPEDFQSKTDVPQLRVRRLNAHRIAPQGDWVVYWMTAFRRTRSNYALQYARDLAKELKRPLIILEALRVGYRWASDRFHRFVIEGMRDNQAACNAADVLYYPYVEAKPGEGSGLVEALADQACAVVTDDYPCFFHPRMLRAIQGRLTSPLVAIDANCLMPLQAAERTFTVAHSYRRWMQKTLPQHLQYPPDENPLDGRSTRGLPVLAQIPKKILSRWPTAQIDNLLADKGLHNLPIDHAVGPGAVAGGEVEAARLLRRFVSQRLNNYAEARNQPDEAGASELSPHLHFGHIGPHEIFFEVIQAAGWNPGKLGDAFGKVAEAPKGHDSESRATMKTGKLGQVNGKVHGFWGVDEATEAFLDQLCTWREIGFNMCWRETNYDQLESLPSWALQTIQEHADDLRPQVYSLEQFEKAQTHDEIWNAAQRQLVREGRIHNYLRMLWGKKILQWTPSAKVALQIMIELNNKYGLDGRDPNSYSGIFWVLGRYDRAWGPEREVFGKLRYMTSENTAKKHPLKKYLKRFAD